MKSKVSSEELTGEIDDTKSWPVRQEAGHDLADASREDETQ
jgi:hypothetical protein